MSNFDFSNEYYFMRHPDGAYASVEGYDPDAGEPINEPKIAEFSIGKYSQIKDKVRDYVYAVGRTIVSKKVYDAIAPLNIQGIQLIPATIEVKGVKVENYCYIHFVNNYAALDREKSIYKWNDFLEIANPIEKVVLSNEVLSAIPLNERLAFCLTENTGFQFFHQSVVDAILAVNPDGLILKKVSEYGKGTHWK